jgi:hypothetical protein
MEFNIEELRKERRPLWMTSLGLESPADMLGGGGDIHTDRLAVDWDRSIGAEFEDLEETKVLLEGRDVAEDYIS